jgi:hypothetical protein
MAQRMIRPALMATAAAALLAIGSPLAHSAGGGGAGGYYGLPFSVGPEPTRVGGWVPFPGTTTRTTADAELQRCQDQAHGSAGDKDACLPQRGDKKANSRN